MRYGSRALKGRGGTARARATVALVWALAMDVDTSAKKSSKRFHNSGITRLAAHLWSGEFWSACLS